MPAYASKAVRRVIKAKPEAKCDIPKALRYYSYDWVREKYKWSVGLVAELYKIIGSDGYEIYVSALSSGQYDEHFVKLVCKAQLVLGLTGSDIDGMLGEKTEKAYENWKLENITNELPIRKRSLYEIHQVPHLLKDGVATQEIAALGTSVIVARQEREAMLEQVASVYDVPIDIAEKIIGYDISEKGESSLYWTSLGLPTILAPLPRQASSTSDIFLNSVFWGFAFELGEHFIKILLKKAATKLVLGLSGAAIGGVGVIITQLIAVGLIIWDAIDIAIQVYKILEDYEKHMETIQVYLDKIENGTLIFEIINEIEDFEDLISDLTEEELKTLGMEVLNHLGETLLVSAGELVGRIAADILLSENKRKDIQREIKLFFKKKKLALRSALRSALKIIRGRRKKPQKQNNVSKSNHKDNITKSSHSVNENTSKPVLVDHNQSNVANSKKSREPDLSKRKLTAWTVGGDNVPVYNKNGKYQYHMNGKWNNITLKELKRRAETKRHGNTLGKQPAELYLLYDKDEKYLKPGIAEITDNRYSKKQRKELNGAIAKMKRKGTRIEMKEFERFIEERWPGPLTKEKWAGKANPKHPNYDPNYIPMHLR